MSKTVTDSLAVYWAKRDFAATPEPRGEHAAQGEQLSFVIQKHAATRLHYDFRLELDGVLVSWAVPKGPSYDPTEKRMAIHVEDHPLAYGSFEGTIPAKQYGAGNVIIWDKGTWEPIGDAHQGLAEGKLAFKMHGQKMAGEWELIKIAKPRDKQEAWLLFKKRDAFARSKADYDVVAALPDSVIAHPLAPLEADTSPPRPRRRAVTGAKASTARAKDTQQAAHADPVPGAQKGPLPKTLSPQLATLVSGVPARGDWLYEIKFDGYRILTRFENGNPRLITRRGNDWSSKMPGLLAELKTMGVGSGWLDGEIVVLDEHGVPDFNALQNAFDQEDSADITYFLFDVPFFEGYDLREVELRYRRQLLEAFVNEKGTDHVRFSEAFDADPASILQSACRMDLEGVIAKRADAPYQSRRTETWLKLKCKQRQEFVIVGYTDRSGGPGQIGSLILGVYDAAGALIAVGSVGTGWSGEEAGTLKTKLSKLEQERPAFANEVKKPGRWSKRRPGTERWVEPRLVVEVEFAEWTPEGQIRHASYIGLRSDKPAKNITRETAKPLAGNPATREPTTAASEIKVSHGDRVIDPSTGLTKLELVRYYESVSDWILPHLKGRPCSLVRGPNGITGQLFFQKHGEKIGIPGITELDASLWPGHASLLEIGNAKALAGAAQLNVIEFHTWNSLARDIDHPDRMIFDLDPGEGTPWKHMQEAATLMRAMLQELDLEAWLKTSGGKGLHVVVPLTPKLDFDTVKAFSQAIVQHMAKTIPARFVAKSGASNRVGKIFIDYIRNGHDATTAAAFSARARPGLGVSMPVEWEQLPKLKRGDQWTIANAREYLSFQTTDPWRDYWKKKQTLTAAMKKLAFKALA